MPFSLSEYLQAPVEVSGPAVDDSGTWALYPDLPPAREPYVNARPVPGAAEEAAHLRAVILMSLSGSAIRQTRYLVAAGR
jgi:hypothetical protein